ncbi:MAG: hypothetical protein H7249_07295 [Chitinophagaceae bacterium]|nr:hypothetical protein [Oligoflexus sp.]
MNKAEIEPRFKALEVWAKAFTAALECDIRVRTGIAVFHCFVLDQFEASFPAEHVTRDGHTVFIALRLALDLKTLPKSAISQVKAHMEPLRGRLTMLRDNFQDSPLCLDFDWHISEKERDDDQGKAFAEKVLNDSLLIKGELTRLETDVPTSAPSL